MQATARRTVLLGVSLGHGKRVEASLLRESFSHRDFFRGEPVDGVGVEHTVVTRVWRDRRQVIVHPGANGEPARQDRGSLRARYWPRDARRTC